MVESDPLFQVSVARLALAAAPIAAISILSWRLGLESVSPVPIGAVRAFVQLSILGYVLTPLFVWGVEAWWLVVGYVFLMILLASYESVARCKYHFEGMFGYVLFSVSVNVTVISMFAFGIVLSPTPPWDPQYVIPIVGVLLGNCINGISLSLNGLLISFVECSREVELLLSFSANRIESCSRLLHDAIRTGTMPQINSLSVVGLISIPGMMTGQISGGSGAVQASRYQILIAYLICACAFGTIFTQVYITIHLCFDSNLVLRTNNFRKRVSKPSIFALLFSAGSSLVRSILRREEHHPIRSSSSSSFAFAANGEGIYLAPKGPLTVDMVPSSSSSAFPGKVILEVSGPSYSFERDGIESNKDEHTNSVETNRNGNGDHSAPVTARRVLFEKVTFQLEAGGVAFINGPSGVGKSTMMRILAGLESPDDGMILLEGKSLSTFGNIPQWRRQVLYVPQSKLDIPGSPFNLLSKLTSFHIWRSTGITPSSFSELKRTVRELVGKIGMNATLLDSEWKALSGGESQCMLIAMALATRPKVIRLDESTSALDNESKIRVEQTVQEYCEKYGMCAIWITHDQSQKNRFALS